MKKIIFTFLFLLLVSGCSGTYQKDYVQSRGIAEDARFVAVLPLVNLTTTPNAGRMVSDILVTELYSATGFRLMESTSMLKRMKGDEDDIEYVVEDVVAQEIGHRLGVDTVVYGSVSEYRYSRGVNQSPAAGINLRMIDVDSGKVLWASSASRTGGCFFGCEDSLNSITQEAVEEMVESMQLQTAQ